MFSIWYAGRPGSLSLGAQPGSEMSYVVTNIPDHVASNPQASAHYDHRNAGGGDGDANEEWPSVFGGIR